MSASVRFQGLEELKSDLRNLPADLRDDARTIVEEAAEGAKTAIQTAYRARGGTGNLARGVVTKKRKAGEYAVRASVESTAAHAFIFENGTQTRKTTLGANRGAMPPGRVFVPIAMRRRRQMNDDLIDMIKRAGFEVRGGG